MNVAIILAGPYRGNKSIIQNHNNIIGNYDTYASCLSHYKDDWLNSGWQLNNLFETPKGTKIIYMQQSLTTEEKFN